MIKGKDSLTLAKVLTISKENSTKN